MKKYITTPIGSLFTFLIHIIMTSVHPYNTMVKELEYILMVILF
jgi:hypothetical protein